MKKLILLFMFIATSTIFAQEAAKIEALGGVGNGIMGAAAAAEGKPLPIQEAIPTNTQKPTEASSEAGKAQSAAAKAEESAAENGSSESESGDSGDSEGGDGDTADTSASVDTDSGSDVAMVNSTVVVGDSEGHEVESDVEFDMHEEEEEP